MLTYIIRRIIAIVPVLLAISFLVFAIAKMTPGDPAAMMLGVRATPDNIARLREQLHLNDPLLTQYGRYIWNILHGDFGVSYKGQTQVLDEIARRFPNSFELGTAAFIFAVVVGIPSGLLAAMQHNHAIDSIISVFALIWLSLPIFWIGILIIILFGVKLNWIPITGGEGFKELIAPAFCLGIGPAAVLARLTRSSVLDVLGEDYIRTARAKGVTERLVRYRHVLRNAMIPIVTFLGLLFADLIGGAVFIEAVFARSGLGTFAIDAINARDMPQIQGIVLFGATLYVTMNLIVDILYSVINPRIVYT
jgi:peptide/nickel transport system permease protein